jgi:hypothetical protein
MRGRPSESIIRRTILDCLDPDYLSGTTWVDWAGRCDDFLGIRRILRNNHGRRGAVPCSDDRKGPIEIVIESEAAMVSLSGMSEQFIPDFAETPSLL